MKKIFIGFVLGYIIGFSHCQNKCLYTEYIKPKKINQMNGDINKIPVYNGNQNMNSNLK
jgi:hypothetical protein